jgi:hypothetical protein
MRARRRALVLEIHRMVSRYSSDRFDLQDSESALVLLFVFRCCRSAVSISLSVTSTWQIPAAPCAPAAEAPSHTSIEICPKKHVEILSLEIDRIVLIWNLANIHLSKFLGLCVVHHRPCEQFRNCSSKYISIRDPATFVLVGFVDV